MPDTGFPGQDAQSDFARARRREVLARLAKRLRREPADVHVVLPFEEVRDALGFRGERSLGLQVIPLDSIVGTVDRTREFDRRFRPTSKRVRDRWQRVAEAQRRERRCRRSPCTGSATCTSSRTATTACPWRGPRGASTSTRT